MSRVKAPEEDERIGARIRQLRLEQALTMVQMLAKVNGRLSQASLSVVENGRSSPGIATLFVVAEALGLDLIDLVADPERDGLHRIIDRLRYLPPTERADFIKQVEHDLESRIEKATVPKKKRRTSRTRERRDVQRRPTRKPAKASGAKGA